MSADRIRELLELMQAHDVVEMELEVPEFKVRLKKPGAVAAPAPAFGPMLLPGPMPFANVVGGTAGGGGVAAGAGKSSAPAPAGGDEEEKLVPIKSPIVGTFYKAAGPDAEPYVSVGSRVDREAVVCIIEAMKIMNEIKAQTSGTIEKVLVENGEPVEFGQTLFLVRP